MDMIHLAGLQSHMGMKKGPFKNEKIQIVQLIRRQGRWLYRNRQPEAFGLRDKADFTAGRFLRNNPS